MAVEESLDRVGYSCRVATSGGEGARLIEEEGPYDVIITDLVMNDIDGLGILAKAKKRDARGGGDPDDRPREHPLGRHGHAAGSLQLPAQAARHRPASHGHREGRRKHAPSAGPTWS